MKCFWAYSNHPHSVKNDVADTVKQINNSGYISIKPWEAMDIEGNFIIDEILKEINKCDVFICELSNLNNNVLYELGYAIAKKKKIRIFINQNLKNVKEEFKSLNLLTTIGFVDYTNSSQMLNSVYNLVDDNEMDILSSILSGISVSNYSNLLYMKSFQETSSSISLTRAIDELKLKLVVDDPKEVSAQTLDWYVTNLIACNGFVAHLQSTKYDDIKVHNAKISLISGIALGLGIPMLMLVEEPFEAPTDYKDIIKKYVGKSECVKHFENWYREYNNEITAEDKFQLHTQQEIRALSGLQNINLGENLAENEAERLLDYYVKTSSYQEALNRNLSIFIGRKGTGKTANLYSLADAYNGKNSHVCVVKPIGYEIEGVLETLENLTNAERGYLVESIWKYLIYTELLKSIYNKIQQYPLHWERDDAEKNVVDFVENNKSIIRSSRYIIPSTHP